MYVPDNARSNVFNTEMKEKLEVQSESLAFQEKRYLLQQK